LCAAILLAVAVSACGSSTTSSAIIGTWNLVSTNTSHDVPSKATFKKTGAVELLVNGATKTGTWKTIDSSHVQVNTGAAPVVEKFVVTGKNLNLYSPGGVKSLYVRKSG
jgi:hypothetical protein